MNTCISRTALILLNMFIYKYFIFKMRLPVCYTFNNNNNKIILNI